MGIMTNKPPLGRPVIGNEPMQVKQVSFPVEMIADLERIIASRKETDRPSFAALVRVYVAKGIQDERSEE